MQVRWQFHNVHDLCSAEIERPEDREQINKLKEQTKIAEQKDLAAAREKYNGLDLCFLLDCTGAHFIR